MRDLIIVLIIGVIIIIISYLGVFDEVYCNEITCPTPLIYIDDYENTKGKTVIQCCRKQYTCTGNENPMHDFIHPPELRDRSDYVIQTRPTGCPVGQIPKNDSDSITGDTVFECCQYQMCTGNYNEEYDIDCEGFSPKKDSNWIIGHTPLECCLNNEPTCGDIYGDGEETEEIEITLSDQQYVDSFIIYPLGPGGNKYYFNHEDVVDNTVKIQVPLKEEFDCSDSKNKLDLISTPGQVMCPQTRLITYTEEDVERCHIEYEDTSDLPPQLARIMAQSSCPRVGDKDYSHGDGCSEELCCRKPRKKCGNINPGDYEAKRSERISAASGRSNTYPDNEVKKYSCGDGKSSIGALFRACESRLEEGSRWMREKNGNFFHPIEDCIPFAQKTEEETCIYSPLPTPILDAEHVSINESICKDEYYARGGWLLDTRHEREELCTTITTVIPGTAHTTSCGLTWRKKIDFVTPRRIAHMGSWTTPTPAFSGGLHDGIANAGSYRDISMAAYTYPFNYNEVIPSPSPAWRSGPPGVVKDYTSHPGLDRIPGGMGYFSNANKALFHVNPIIHSRAHSTTPTEPGIPVIITTTHPPLAAPPPSQVDDPYSIFNEGPDIAGTTNTWFHDNLGDIRADGIGKYYPIKDHYSNLMESEDEVKLNEGDVSRYNELKRKLTPIHSINKKNFWRWPEYKDTTTASWFPRNCSDISDEDEEAQRGCNQIWDIIEGVDYRICGVICNELGESECEKNNIKGGSNCCHWDPTANNGIGYCSRKFHITDNVSEMINQEYYASTLTEEPEYEGVIHIGKTERLDISNIDDRDKWKEPKKCLSPWGKGYNEEEFKAMIRDERQREGKEGDEPSMCNGTSQAEELFISDLMNKEVGPDPPHDPPNTTLLGIASGEGLSNNIVNGSQNWPYIMVGHMDFYFGLGGPDKFLKKIRGNRENVIGTIDTELIRTDNNGHILQKMLPRRMSSEPAIEPPACSPPECRAWSSPAEDGGTHEGSTISNVNGLNVLMNTESNGSQPIKINFDHERDQSYIDDQEITNIPNTKYPIQECDKYISTNEPIRDRIICIKEVINMGDTNQEWSGYLENNGNFPTPTQPHWEAEGLICKNISMCIEDEIFKSKKYEEDFEEEFKERIIEYLRVINGGDSIVSLTDIIINKYDIINNENINKVNIDWNSPGEARIHFSIVIPNKSLRDKITAAALEESGRLGGSTMFHEIAQEAFSTVGESLVGLDRDVNGKLMGISCDESIPSPSLFPELSPPSPNSSTRCRTSPELIRAELRRAIVEGIVPEPPLNSSGPIGNNWNIVSSEPPVTELPPWRDAIPRPLPPSSYDFQRNDDVVKKGIIKELLKKMNVTTCDINDGETCPYGCDYSSMCIKDDWAGLSPGKMDTICTDTEYPGGETRCTESDCCTWKHRGSITNPTMGDMLYAKCCNASAADVGYIPPAVTKMEEVNSLGCGSQLDECRENTSCDTHFSTAIATPSGLLSDIPLPTITEHTPEAEKEKWDSAFETNGLWEKLTNCVREANSEIPTTLMHEYIDEGKCYHSQLDSSFRPEGYPVDPDKLPLGEHVPEYIGSSGYRLLDGARNWKPSNPPGKRLRSRVLDQLNEPRNYTTACCPNNQTVVAIRGNDDCSDAGGTEREGLIRYDKKWAGNWRKPGSPTEKLRGWDSPTPRHRSEKWPEEVIGNNTCTPDDWKLEHLRKDWDHPDNRWENTQMWKIDESNSGPDEKWNMTCSHVYLPGVGEGGIEVPCGYFPPCRKFTSDLEKKRITSSSGKLESDYYDLSDHNLPPCWSYFLAKNKHDFKNSKIRVDEIQAGSWEGWDYLGVWGTTGRALEAAYRGSDDESSQVACNDVPWHQQETPEGGPGPWGTPPIIERVARPLSERSLSPRCDGPLIGDLNCGDYSDGDNPDDSQGWGRLLTDPMEAQDGEWFSGGNRASIGEIATIDHIPHDGPNCMNYIYQLQKILDQRETDEELKLRANCKKAYEWIGQEKPYDVDPTIPASIQCERCIDGIDPTYSVPLPTIGVGIHRFSAEIMENRAEVAQNIAAEITRRVGRSLSDEEQVMFHLRQCDVLDSLREKIEEPIETQLDTLEDMVNRTVESARDVKNGVSPDTISIRPDFMVSDPLYALALIEKDYSDNGAAATSFCNYCETYLTPYEYFDDYCS